MTPVHKQTKIVATVGKVCDTPEKLTELVHAGVNVFRINLKHETLDIQSKRIETILEVRKNLEVPVGILVDLQGPQLRVFTQNQESFGVHIDEVVDIDLNPNADGARIHIPLPIRSETIQSGDRLFMDDGRLEFEIVGSQDQHLSARALREGEIKNGKGVNIPGRQLDLPSLTDTDLKQLEALAVFPIDFVALSFVRRAGDIEQLRQVLTEKKWQARIVAKIETLLALQNLSEVIEASDGIMVARGDLGVEIALEDIAFWQKEIVHRCVTAHKPVIVATEMLQSMITSPLPTRAEATDVANAVYDGTDAVMLSGETASGQYPVQAVQTMANIVSASERRVPFLKPSNHLHNGAEVMAEMTLTVLERYKQFKVDKLVVFTHTGYTAQALASLRPKVPILVITNQADVVGAMTLVFGVKAYCFDFPSGTFTIPNPILSELKTQGIIAVGQRLVVIHGYHWNEPDRANTLSLIEVG